MMNKWNLISSTSKWNWKYFPPKIIVRLNSNTDANLRLVTSILIHPNFCIDFLICDYNIYPGSGVFILHIMPNKGKYIFKQAVDIPV